MKVSILVFALAVTSLAYSADVPTWSNVYSATGVLYLPYAEIEEPFSAWYDAPNQQSRVDYYGDTVQTYQLATTYGYGTSLKVVPLTDEEKTNVKTCLQVNGTADDDRVEIQSIVPSLEGFELIGEETILGVDTEKWQFVQITEEKVSKYTIWLRYEADANGEQITIPVRYEMDGYDSLIGSHYDRYYLEYNTFEVGLSAANVFELNPPNLTCTSFPGPGLQHIYTFNPMAEFVQPVKTAHLDYHFEEFKEKHQKVYESESEHTQRKEVFKQNLRFIHSVNRQNRGFTLGVNHLADKTELELKTLRGKIPSSGFNGGAPFPLKKSADDDLPEQFDWRLYGAVTPVKDQAVCGSCWSFSTVGTLEGALFLREGKLTKLSEQALVDCSWGYGNNGCDGGEDFRSYQWILKHGGIPTDESYGSYLGEDSYCHADNAEKVAQISGYVNVTANDQEALKLAIFKQGPISVAIDASPRTFGFYSNGVLYEPTCKNGPDELDHAVLAVGYGTLNGEDYWLIKNSWSTYWGNDGYILMAARDNNCGVMTMPTYAVLK